MRLGSSNGPCTLPGPQGPIFRAHQGTFEFPTIFFYYYFLFLVFFNASGVQAQTISQSLSFVARVLQRKNIAKKEKE